MRRWTEAEYEELFGKHPPTASRCPTTDECIAMGASLRRTPGAIKAQWDDGRSMVLGQVSAASTGLRDYLMRHTWF